jgi:septum formation protein
MSDRTHHLFLASRSPRREALLGQLGLKFELLDVDLVETPEPGEAVEDYVRRLAREKAGAGLFQVAAVPGAVVIGADTEVELDGEIFGKPVDASDAARMLARLAGREHRVLTAVAVIDSSRERELVNVSGVRIAAMDAAAIRAYVASGEPFGKAGGYAVQGLAAAYICHLAGSFSGVMGLPLYETAVLLRDFGIGPGVSGP